MSKLLVIKSNLIEGKSISCFATDLFIKNYQTIYPNDEIEFLNLNNNKKVMEILNSNNFNNFWNEESDILIDQLKSADKIIISGGMINFNVPTTLKSYFDNVLQANKTFKYKYNGKGQSIGLLNPNIKVQLILSQGAEEGWYPFGLFDKYIEGTLNFMGLTNIQTIVFFGTKANSKKNLSLLEIVDQDKIIKLSNEF